MTPANYSHFNRHGVMLVLCAAMVCCSASLPAQDNLAISNVNTSPSLVLRLPAQFLAADAPEDSTGKIVLTWPAAADEAGIEYVVFKASAASHDAITTEVATIKTGAKDSLQSGKPAWFGPWRRNKQFYFQDVKLTRDAATGQYESAWFILGIRPAGRTDTLALHAGAVTAAPRSNWFKLSKANNLLILVLLYLFVWLYIEKAKRNPNIFLRKIAGLEAVEEAIGRATEMGKPILYSTGYYDASEISTIASINILGEVAKKVANYDSRLIVPSKWPVAMTVCQEVVREAFLNAGRPDAYNNDDIFFIAGEQFSYTAAVNGLMMREKPAANFFLGTFAAEALLLAETGNMIGAIQISGTDSVYQIPFFIAACDYCLIGEELYAASAYLSREPRIVGTLKGQDMGKILLVFMIIIGALSLTAAEFLPDAEFLHYLKYLMSVY